MKTSKPTPAEPKGIAFVLRRIATSPWALRTALFFSVFLAVLLALVFGVGFSRILLWILPLPLLILSAVLAFRTLWNSQSVSAPGPKVYDKAKYHYDGDFPKGLPRKQAFVHTGMFVSWLIEHDMIAPDFLEETQGFKERKVSGAQVYKAWDGCLTSDVLTDEGNRFASDYFGSDDSSEYLNDYAEALAKDLPSLYHVADSWENFGSIKDKIDQRYEVWKKKQK